MLVVFGTFVINLQNVQSFWYSDEIRSGPDIQKGFFIKFSDRQGHKIDDFEVHCIPFKSKENRDKVYKDILFAYQEGLRVFAVINEETEVKE